MEVACGKCGARGRVPDAQVAAGPVAVRCSACGGVMHVGEAAKPERADAWYLDSGQGAQGPYRIGELVALWRADKITWNAKLWRDGDPEWSPARGHSAFIDAIFVHDERSVAPSAGASTSASTGAIADRPPPPDRAAGPGTRLPPLPAQRPNSERTSPAYDAAAAEHAAASAPERTPHDSLAPFERVARAAGKRWPAAIVLGSGAIAGAVVLWALSLRPAAPAAPPTAVAVEHAPASSEPEPAPVLAAAASGPQLVAVAPPAGAIEPAGVPAAEAPLPAAAATLPAAEAKPLPAAPRAPAPVPALVAAAGTRPARSAAGVLAEQPADERAIDADEASAAGGEEGAVAATGEPLAPSPQPAPRHAPDFMTAAEPLPDMPTTREIASAMRGVAPAVRACAESSTPTTVTVSVAITGKTGRVARVQVPQVSGSLQSCIATAVRAAQFPAFDRPELELRFPFLISQ